MNIKQTAENFWSRVKKVESGCMEWQGCLYDSGYGRVRIDNKTYKAHRVAAYLSGLLKSLVKPRSAKSKTHVLHKCDNKKCCNPNHLFLGTHADNMKDMYRKGRSNHLSGSTHGMAKFNNQQINRIIARYSKGQVTQKELAKIYKVSHGTINKIINRVSYL